MRQKSFGYLRVSSAGQIDGHGFARQRKTIQDYADRNNLDVIQYFKEQVSGTKGEEDRPVFQEMISQILLDGVRTIIIEGIDRLARRIGVAEQIMLYLSSKGIDLISAETRENLTQAVRSDPMRAAMIQIQQVFAELERNLLVAKLRKAREEKKRLTGRCEGRKSLKETNPALIKEMRRLRRAKPGHTRMTYGRIAESLNEQGFTNQTGGSLNETFIKTVFNRLKK